MLSKEVSLPGHKIDGEWQRRCQKGQAKNSPAQRVVELTLPEDFKDSLLEEVIFGLHSER